MFVHILLESLVFLEEVGDCDHIFAMILGAELSLNIIHPALQVLQLTVEVQRL